MEFFHLSIDQSYTSTGYCIFQCDSLINFGIISSCKDDDIHARANYIAREITSIAKSHNVRSISLEGLAFGKFGNATRDLAGLQFVIINHLRFQHGFDVKVYPPQTIKKVATGKGTSKKQLLVESLPSDVLKAFESSGLKRSSGLYDVTDAYWIGITHWKNDLMESLKISDSKK